MPLALTVIKLAFSENHSTAMPVKILPLIVFTTADNRTLLPGAILVLGEVIYTNATFKSLATIVTLTNGTKKLL